MAPKQAGTSTQSQNATSTRTWPAGDSPKDLTSIHPKRRNVIRPTETMTLADEIGQPVRNKNDSVVAGGEIIESSGEEDSEDGEGDDYEYDDDDEYGEDEDEDEDDDDDDDIESIYLSDSDEPAHANTKQITKAPSSSAARRTDKDVSQPLYTYTETRTASQWLVARQRTQGSARDVTISRGATATRQQTVHQHSQRSNTLNQQERGLSRGNSMRLNMSLNLDVSFSGLVTGRNLSLAGGQLSYSWARSRQG